MKKTGRGNVKVSGIGVPFSFTNAGPLHGIRVRERLILD